MQQLLSQPAGIAAVAVIGLILLFGFFRIAAWVLSGLLNVAFLLLGAALAGVAMFGWKTQNQMIMIAGMGGLFLIVLVGMLSKKKPQGGG